MRWLARAAAVLGIVLALVVVMAGVAILIISERVASRQSEDRVLSAPPFGVFVDAGDSRLFVQQLGNSDAPAVVFVHGTGAWSEAWRASMEQAAARGFHAIAIDMPPFGYSVPPASGDYSKPAQARRLLAVLDRLKVQHAIFIAHSFGAAPVMEALLRAPQRATGIVLVDAALGLERPHGGDNAIQRLSRQAWFAESVSAAFLTNPDFTGLLLRSFITEKEKATSSWIALYRRPLNLSGTYRHVAAWLPELLAARGDDPSDQPDAYRRIAVPVTLIWGENDAITPVGQAEYLQSLIPHARLLRIPSAGHIPQIEEAVAFQKALAAALGSP